MALHWDLAVQPKANFLFAHGAGAGLDSDFMQHMATLIAAQGINVARFDFTYMQQANALNKRRPPDKADKLLACFKAYLEEIDNGLPTFIGGKSMGGRMATLLACDNSLNIAGVLAFGYPFHPPGKPEKLRTEHFSTITLPTLILQGERDTFGTREEVGLWSLPETLQWYWLADGDHSFKPRKASGFSEAQHRQSAANRAVTFMQEQLCQ
ncbi:alpha/beta family hydrolase [Pseudoalteromonas fenneropenaei]|uniref:Alpha/beta family hydrolase n=1 Tax=Pseudoalteromonas fenneropenaei TaxID=1737459 RepID=A0ABV7CGP5_9GAMM